MTDFVDRWKLLKPRERAVVWHFIVLGEKRYAAGCNLGIRLSRTSQLLDSVYRLLGVSGAIELAFAVGRNYERIEFTADIEDVKEGTTK